LIPTKTATTDIQENRPRSRPGKNTKAPSQRKKSALSSSVPGGCSLAVKEIRTGSSPAARLKQSRTALNPAAARTTWPSRRLQVVEKLPCAQSPRIVEGQAAAA